MYFSVFFLNSEMLFNYSVTLLRDLVSVNDSKVLPCRKIILLACYSLSHSCLVVDGPGLRKTACCQSLPLSVT